MSSEKISFVVLTVGNKPEELKQCLSSIHKNFESDDLHEIVLVGNNIPSAIPQVSKIINENKYVEFLGKRRNIGTKESSGSIIVHCDDDIIFSQDWYSNFLNYNKKNKTWQIMGNKVLLPDGNRYWDRSIFLPRHQMVPYDFNSEDVTFYQSGAFCVASKSLLEKISWSDEIPFYGISKGFRYNEDVEFSLRLKGAGVKIDFDENNLVWHNDFSYTSNGLVCNKMGVDKNSTRTCLDFVLSLS